MTTKANVLAAAVFALLGDLGDAVAPAGAQQPTAAPPTAPSAAAAAPLPYGGPITMEAARRAMAAAEAEATRNNWGVAIAIVDSGGHLVMLHRLDGTQIASIRIAEGKARTALEFRRPTKALEDAVAGGGAALRLLAVEGLYPLEGGVLIEAAGRIVGAIGVSGVLSSQDAQVARAGAEAAATAAR
jgi:glc operon protein GlcG